jgi:hypothetical protein
MSNENQHHLAQAWAFGTAAAEAAKVDKIFVITSRTADWLKAGEADDILDKRDAFNSAVEAVFGEGEFHFNPNFQGLLSTDGFAYFHTVTGPVSVLWPPPEEERDEIVLYDVYQGEVPGPEALV